MLDHTKIHVGDVIELKYTIVFGNGHALDRGDKLSIIVGWPASDTGLTIGHKYIITDIYFSPIGPIYGIIDDNGKRKELYDSEFEVI